jgi:hypothetical protein
MLQTESENSIINMKIEIFSNLLPKKQIIEYLALNRNEYHPYHFSLLTSMVLIIPEGMIITSLSQVIHPIKSEDLIICMS